MVMRFCASNCRPLIVLFIVVGFVLFSSFVATASTTGTPEEPTCTASEPGESQSPIAPVVPSEEPKQPPKRPPAPTGPPVKDPTDSEPPVIDKLAIPKAVCNSSSVAYSQGSGNYKWGGETYCGSYVDNIIIISYLWKWVGSSWSFVDSSTDDCGCCCWYLWNHKTSWLNTGSYAVTSAHNVYDPDREVDYSEHYWYVP